jgi:hypothetical protein
MPVSAWTKEDLLAELEVLAGTDSWANLAERLDTNSAALARRLHRMGRHHLARKVEQEIRETRAK